MVYIYSEGADLIVDFHTYFWPYHRIAPYVVGLILAFIMQKTESKVKMNKVSNSLYLDMI